MIVEERHEVGAVSRDGDATGQLVVSRASAGDALPTSGRVDLDGVGHSDASAEAKRCGQAGLSGFQQDRSRAGCAGVGEMESPVARERDAACEGIGTRERLGAARVVQDQRDFVRSPILDQSGES